MINDFGSYWSINAFKRLKIFPLSHGSVKWDIFKGQGGFNFQYDRFWDRRNKTLSIKGDRNYFGVLLIWQFLHNIAFDNWGGIVLWLYLTLSGRYIKALTSLLLLTIHTSSRILTIDVGKGYIERHCGVTYWTDWLCPLFD